ncbi:MAG TPA: hypothetical protein VKQ08_05640 [Cyclobacteriaceae bacterium]|nr:hypothetical protein [Cyclobacteriaceae bacterium]
MRGIKSLLLGLILVLITDSCLEQPTYSVVPYIELVDLTFKPGDISKQIQDTLIISLRFKDGDGDLGKGPDDSLNWDSYSPWYWAYDTTNFSTGYVGLNTIALPGAYKFLTYRVKRTIVQFDTLPAIGCINWEQYFKGPLLEDTLFVTQNPNAFNLTVDVYTSSNGGQNYTRFDPSTYFAFPNCNVNMFNTAFPNLSSDMNKKSPLEGILKYKIQSYALRSIFSIATLKMYIQIKDRAGHLSDTVKVGGFTLASITK